MTRRLLAAPLLALAAFTFACGGGGDDADGPTSTPEGSPTATFTAQPTSQATATPTPETALPTATPLAAGDTILSIVAGGTSLTPTASEFNAYPQTSITAAGTTYSGVTLEALAAEAGTTGAFFEIEGVRSDGVRYAIVRYALAEMGGTSLLVLSDAGRVDFVSSSLDPSQWLTAVTAVTFS